MRIALRMTKRALRVTQLLLCGLGFTLLAYCAYAAIDSRIFQIRANEDFERLQSRSSGADALPGGVTSGVMGRVEISRLNVSVAVVEGSTDAILRHAAGHITGTALPGEPGNVGISAHRDTFFRPLRNIRRGDVITITSLTGTYRYRVDFFRIVPPSDVSVLNPDTRQRQILTLVTCYPFYFIGPAPDRFIVRAERII